MMKISAFAALKSIIFQHYIDNYAVHQLVRKAFEIICIFQTRKNSAIIVKNFKK
jgi:hypothetical protein